MRLFCIRRGSTLINDMDNVKFVLNLPNKESSLIISPTITPKHAMDMNDGSGALAYSYSGQHDHGTLPILHSSGHYIELLSSLKIAKTAVDVILIEEISTLKEIQQHEVKQHEGEIVTSKRKVF
jgi:hypothetical protein